MKKTRFKFDDTNTLRSEIETKEVTFDSCYSFLQEHNGWRKGKMHLVLGISGGGKSTLVRSLLVDLFVHGMILGNALVWLSEESEEDLENQVAKVNSRIGSNTLTTISELSVENLSEAYFEETLLSDKPDIFFMDNLTTSQLYEGRSIRDQLLFVKKLKTMCIKLNIPFVLIAHTGAEITENCNRLINMNDIRGAKNIVNLVEYLYLLQRFTLETDFFPTIRIAKSRGHLISNDIHKLVFNPENITYSKSFRIPFEEFKEAFKQRRTL
jgi:RecA-family ATPase